MPRKHFRTMSAGTEMDPKHVSPMPRETYITKHSPMPNQQKATVVRQKRRSVGSTQDLMREINCTPLVYSKSAKKSTTLDKEPEKDANVEQLNEVKAIFNDFKQKTKNVIISPKPCFSHEFVLRMIFCSWRGWAFRTKYGNIEFK